MSYQNESLELWRERIEFCEKHLPHFESNHFTTDNGDSGKTRLSMFTILTQRIYGNSVCELIDKGRTYEKTK